MLGTMSRWSRWSEWSDRDEITAEDLKGPLTAEEEVLDWMAETPAPPVPRPSWLPAGPASTPGPAPSRRVKEQRVAPTPWAAIALGVVTVGALGASAAVSVIGVAIALL
jgi:hypothetical protein